jgi:hypothetical protein
MTNYEKLFGTLEKATVWLCKSMKCAYCPQRFGCKVNNREEEWDYCYLQIETYLKREVNE